MKALTDFLHFSSPSSGACIAYLTGLTSERKLAGIAALSGWLGMADKIKSVSLTPWTDGRA